jgi:hypothetical protein
MSDAIRKLETERGEILERLDKMIADLRANLGDGETFDPTLALRWRADPAGNVPPVLERGWLGVKTRKVVWRPIPTVTQPPDEPGA